MAKLEDQVKILKYCKEQGIPIGKPIQDGENWIYPIDMKDITVEQYKYLTKETNV